MTMTLLVLVSLACGAATALACPVCFTDTGAHVRAGIYAGFAGNLLVAVAPFVVLAVLVRIVPGMVALDGPRPPPCQRLTTDSGEDT